MPSAPEIAKDSGVIMKSTPLLWHSCSAKLCASGKFGSSRNKYALLVGTWYYDRNQILFSMLYGSDIGLLLLLIYPQ